MHDEQERLLQLALIGLEAERVRLEQQLRRLQDRTGVTVGGAGRVAEDKSRTITMRSSPNKGKKMTEEQKRKISATMKARWATVRGKKRRA